MILTNLCKDTAVDGWLDPVTSRLCQGDYVALVICHQHGGYRFDRGTAGSLKGKPVVVLDFMEYGWDRSWRNDHIAGENSHEWCLNGNEEYRLLDGWLGKQRVVAYFKRELSPQVRQRAGNRFPIHPVELLATDNPVPEVSKDQWMKRTGGIFHLYGYSHEDRKHLHAAMQVRLGTVANSLDAIEHPGRPCSHYAEQRDYWARYSMGRALAAQREFALSVALPGAGVKTFRDGEACNGSVPVICDIGMERAIPWDADNAILLPSRDGRLLVDEAMEILCAALEDREALFPKAMAATDICRRMRLAAYVEDHINQIIRKNL